MDVTDEGIEVAVSFMKDVLLSKSTSEVAEKFMDYVCFKHFPLWYTTLLEFLDQMNLKTFISMYKEAERSEFESTRGFDHTKDNIREVFGLSDNTFSQCAKLARIMLDTYQQLCSFKLKLEFTRYFLSEVRAERCDLEVALICSFVVRLVIDEKVDEFLAEVSK